MTLYPQFRDLPQIPSFSEDPQYTVWANEHMPYRQQAVRVEDDYYHHERVATGYAGMQTMERFLVDPSPMSHGLLQAKLDHGIPFHSEQYSRYEQYPTPDLVRYDSPDRTSVSGNSSYATQNEIRSPLPYNSYPYNSPEDYTQRSLPYPTTDHMKEAPYSSDVPMHGGSIALRDIEYEHEPEPEPILEEAEPIHLKTDAPYDQEVGLVKMDAAPDNYQEYPDSRATRSLRNGESVQPMEPSEEETSDADYTPNQSTRRRRSSASTSSSSRYGQRRRPNHGRKNSSTSTTHVTRVNKRSGRHSASFHTGKTAGDAQANGDALRHFPCPLAMYGCQSTFQSKNEWKRHVSTQHIKLGFWRCNLCATTVDPNDDQTIYHNDFNRKDLFTQHLRRMHSSHPGQSARDKREYPVNEDNIAEHQKSCFLRLRDTPPKSCCLFCGETFTGSNSWENRMEHIGRHLEKDRKAGLKLGEVENWNKDADLEQWLLEEGIIAWSGSQWKIGDGRPRRHSSSSNDEESEEEA